MPAVATGSFSFAGQDEVERSDEERYPGPTGWGLICWTSTPTLAKTIYQILRISQIDILF